MKHLYNEDYYERGVEKGISGYQNYRWMPEHTLTMCKSIVDHCKISQKDKLLDFGCAKGFTVKAMNSLGYDCIGCDISEYAISQSDEETKEKLHVFNGNLKELLVGHNINTVISKDVFEHIPKKDLDYIVNDMSFCNKLFVVVPLAKNGKYVIPEYESDVTHVIREDEEWWIELFKKRGYDVHFQYLVPKIKDNWSSYKKGNGFLLCKKLKGTF